MMAGQPQTNEKLTLEQGDCVFEHKDRSHSGHRHGRKGQRKKTKAFPGDLCALLFKVSPCSWKSMDFVPF